MTLHKKKSEVFREQILILEALVGKMGYAVVYSKGAEDCVELEDKVIHINSRNHPETKFYTLLHEYGHAYIYENLAEKFEMDYPQYFRLNDKRTERSKSAKVSIVAEEIEAWKIGRQLARNTGMYINESKYDEHMTQNLMSYINWAADGS